MRGANNGRGRAATALVSAGMMVLAGCGGTAADGSAAGNVSRQLSAAPVAVAAASPWPVWSGWDFPYNEPPLATTPAVAFGVSQLT